MNNGDALAYVKRRDNDVDYRKLVGCFINFMLKYPSCDYRYSELQKGSKSSILCLSSMEI